MTPQKLVYAISICGRLTIDMHALNNEGTEGNQMLTRQVTIVDSQGELQSVNAISGDMLKHIQAEHLTSIAITDGLKICAPCRRLDPNRIAADKDFIARVKGKSDADVTDDLLCTCAITDMEGILLTEGRATPRASVVEYGWLVGLPDKVHTESYIHLKRVPDPGDTTSGQAENLGQNLFHRPANSGEYAAILHIEVARIGFNDFSRTYPLNAEERLARYKSLLKSVLFSFLEPNGAQRNTQAPHILGFKGVIGISRTACPAPTISPLSDNYESEIQSISQTLNEIIGCGSIEIRPFASLSQFATAIQFLITDTEPYSFT